jgi:arylsulfatase A-like enzyme
MKKCQLASPRLSVDPEPADGIKRRDLLLCGSSLVAASAFASAGLTTSVRAQQPSVSSGRVNKPNIVVILADDHGNADLGYHGSDIKTPNIDTLAANGVRLESFYGMPVCTPARAALMTGRYPMRYGLQTLVIFPSHNYGLPTEERTLPQALREAGYRTAMVGKWHLGHADEKYWPQNRGFEHFYGNLVGEVDYFSKERGGLIDWQRNGQFLKENGYFTTLIGDEVRLIEASLAPHAPYQAPQDYVDRYKAVVDEKRRTYAAMITALDDQVGRIVAALEKKNMRSNTLIVFSSDNGGATSALFATGARSEAERKAEGIEQGAKPPASNGDLRGGKGSLHEGGVRVPTFANWPERLKPAVSNEPLHMVDLMPMFLALAGASGSSDHAFDGKDIWPTLSTGRSSPREDILINVEAVRGAIRKGKWKLVKWAPLPGRIELYDLLADPGERNNLVGQHPEIVRDLENRLLDYARQMKPAEWVKAQPQFLGAQGQTVFDPDFDIDDGGLPHEKPELPGVISRALK